MGVRLGRVAAWGIAVWVLAAGLGPAPAGAAPAEQVLLDFEQGFDFAKVKTTDARASEVKGEKGSALRVETFHRQEWPGITLVAPRGTWDLSRFAHLTVDVKNTGANEVSVRCRVDNTGADGVSNCNNGSITLKPGEAGVLRVDFKRRATSVPGVKLFGMRGYPFSGETKGTIDPAKVTQLLIFVGKPAADHAFEIDNVRATGEYVAMPPPPADKPFLPFIDTFGQYVHRDWPGKVHSLAELAGRVREEDEELKQKPGPEDWDQYGGWKGGPQLQATGFFRVEKHQGKWWLVDPEGRLYWSHGMDCVRSGDHTPIDDRKEWFQEFPGDRPELREFLAEKVRTLHGYYKGREPRAYNFAGANMKRKYGEEWVRRSAEIAHRRLRSWGVNTIANWSSPETYLMRKTPYTATVGFTSKLLEGSQGYWGQFRDVFDPSFAPAVLASMEREKGKTAGDPWCLGYFVDNEISWGDELSLAIAALVSPPEQTAKKVFIQDLKAKYPSIEALNAAWGTTHASWDALLASRVAPDKQKARADLLAFSERTADTYFRVIREAVKAVAPNQLYLGCRFAWVNGLAVKAAAKHCDVVSYNLYRRSVADFRLPVEADVPLIIGEFHFGALDRGMFHTGLVSVPDQAARARAYQEYVQGALRHPQFVGCHWFKYQDEPTTGRSLDEENYQIGFVDIADTPYRETVDACREVGYGMYRYRLEK